MECQKKNLTLRVNGNEVVFSRPDMTLIIDASRVVAKDRKARFIDTIKELNDCPNAQQVVSAAFSNMLTDVVSDYDTRMWLISTEGRAFTYNWMLQRTDGTLTTEECKRIVADLSPDQTVEVSKFYMTELFPEINKGDDDDGDDDDDDGDDDDDVTNED